MAVIEVDGLRRTYGAKPGYEAVRGVSFAVGEGELFALLGTNGAGKTSTMEVVEGLARPTAGSVRVFGRDPLRERRLVRPRCGIMLQEGGFPADLTVAETARMWAGTVTRPRPTSEALEMVGLAGRADVPVKQLSGGERRRLDLALALTGRPQVLFLDEPTTGLDPESRRNTWRLVRDIVADGTTVVLTTHYLEEAEQLADRLAIMRRGQVVAEGTVADIVAAHPAEIRFDTPPGRALPFLGDVGAAADGHQTVVRTHDLQPTLTALLTWADQHQVQLRSLRAATASLETAFLTLAREPQEASL